VRITLTGLEATVDGTLVASRAPDPGQVALGPVEVELDVRTGDGGAVMRWSVANRADTDVHVTSVSAVYAVHAMEPVRMLRHGYQSWSPTGVATLGHDADPSTRADLPFLQAVHHADQRTVVAPGELRSEWVTALADAGGDIVVAGFDGAGSHDGTWRLRPSGDGHPIELRAEAFLGDVRLRSGECRPLHEVTVGGGPGAVAEDVARLLGRWADRVGRASAARTGAPYQVGWCSWYQYFHDVTERDLRANLALAEHWPFDVFLLDDGYQAAIGDWLDTNERFPSGLAGLAEDIRASGRVAGIWLAPFLAAPDSRVATRHPDWLAARAAGRPGPLFAWWNPPWGGGRDGFMGALDTTRPEVLAHLEDLGRALRDMGWTWLKLDFTFAPSVEGHWADADRTPAERVRAGFEAIRRGAGDDVFIVGCGVPLSHVVGVVDAVRIGQDVAPLWALRPEDEIVPGYLGIQPATRHAYGNTVARSFMHRRLWLNDPDCLMLRSTGTALSPTAARTWAQTVGLSGGAALVSDDLSLLGDDARRLLDEVVALGRASDDLARAGRPAEAIDLLERTPPTTFVAGPHRLIVDPESGAGRQHHRGQP
jgi:alpha-galactosidase